MMPNQGVPCLLDFVRQVHDLVTLPGQTEAMLLPAATRLLTQLIATDAWLPDDCARPHPVRYQQYLLYGDPLDRFSVVSFVWAPGQATPIHDHTVWGLVGVLRGAEYNVSYRLDSGRLVPNPVIERYEAGEVAVVSPTIGDIHQVRNAHPDKTSVSIHLYGGNIGRIRRHVFDPLTGTEKTFVSGYANVTVPNLWRAEPTDL